MVIFVVDLTVWFIKGALVIDPILPVLVDEGKKHLVVFRSTKLWHSTLQRVSVSRKL